NNIAVGIEEWGPAHHFDSVEADDVQLAGYGQLGLRIANRLMADAGVRIEREEYDSVFRGGDLVIKSNAADGSQIFWPNPPAFIRLKASDRTVMPKLSLSFQKDDRSLWYTTIARGFRMGGVNGVPPMTWLGIDCGAFPKSYAPDTVWSYEVGVKHG